MKLVLCISDSLGLPRMNVPYENTWFSILIRAFPSMNFVSYFQRSGTTDMLSSNNYGDTLLFYTPQIVILQLGICDCAPRYLRTNSIGYRLLLHFPNYLSKPIWTFIKKVKHRSLNCTDVTIEKFEKNLNDYILMCKENAVEKIIIVKIAIPGKAMIKANPLILESIARYNSIYEKIANTYSNIICLIDPISTSDDTLFVDNGYHTNKKGHKIIANELIKVIGNN